MKSSIITLLFIITTLMPSFAAGRCDTIPAKRDKFDKIADSKVFKSIYAGTPMLIGGMALYGADRNLKDSPTTFAKHYDNPFEDYLQYAPGAALLAMKIAGVESRSSWPRLLVSDAFSAVIMIGVSENLKRAVKEMRPDGEDNRSFPSGHTAVSYMMATMLHKEYGHISPWISLGSYAIAATTATSRMLHNRHWMSDILVGAGIGVLSTELGYFIGDIVFKDKGITDYFSDQDFYRWESPSFLSIDLGMNLSLTNYTLPGGKIELSTGASTGIQGAYFFNPYIGIGGNAGISALPVKYNGNLAQEPMKAGRLYCGAYFSYPIFTRLGIGAKVTAGYNYYGKCSLTDCSIGGKSTPGFETGLSISFKSTENFGARIYCDYGFTGSYVPGNDKIAQSIIIGGATSINF